MGGAHSCLTPQDGARPRSGGSLGYTCGFEKGPGDWAAGSRAGVPAPREQAL